MSKPKPSPRPQTLTKDQRVMRAIPTHWVDSLLTGPDGIGQPPYDCRDIEKLLRGVQDRVRAALKKEQ